MSVDVIGVVFEGIEFKLVAGGTTSIYILDAAQTTAVRGLTFIDCYFNMNSVDNARVIGLRSNDATNAITGLVMRGCTLLGMGSTTRLAVGVLQHVSGLLSAPVLSAHAVAGGGRGRPARVD